MDLYCRLTTHIPTPIPRTVTGLLLSTLTLSCHWPSSGNLPFVLKPLFMQGFSLLNSCYSTMKCVITIDKGPVLTDVATFEGIIDISSFWPFRVKVQRYAISNECLYQITCQSFQSGQIIGSIDIVIDVTRKIPQN